MNYSEASPFLGELRVTAVSAFFLPPPAVSRAAACKVFAAGFFRAPAGCPG